MLSTMQTSPLTLTTILRYAGDVHGDRVVTTASGGGAVRHSDYRDFGSRCARLANGLRTLGVTSDQRVATFMWNNQEHLEAYLAVPCMGAVLHTLNIRLFPEQIEYIALQAEDQVVLADLSLAGVLAPILRRMPTVHTVIAVGDGDMSELQQSGKRVVRYHDLLAASDDHFDWPDLDENSAAAMCYTSGTSGRPKGVVYSHKSTYLHSMTVCTGNLLGLDLADKVLPIVPMFHANAWGLPYATLMAGADLLMPDRFLDGKSLINLIETQRPTVAGAVPTIWKDVIDVLDREPGREISSLRLVVCGGSAVPVSMMRDFETRHQVPIRQLWGMTETSPMATAALPPPNLEDAEHWALRGTQGRPICGVEARIVDDNGCVLPNDGSAVGELEVRGGWITSSYYRVTAPDNFDRGWLRTGDIARIDRRGYVSLTDRAKDVIKSGGEWISSVELENHLIAHPAVHEAVVVGVPDDRWQERPLAAIVTKPGEDPTPRELQDFLAEKVVRWWLPERWTFLHQIPRTSVGKYDKKVVRAEYGEGKYTIIDLPRN
jgi:fatty-acyl-CoA synthase